MSLDGLFQKKISAQYFVKSMELLLLSAGVITTFFTFKLAAALSSYDLVITSLSKSLFCFRNWLSSPFFICIIINFMVFLIAASSLAQNHLVQGNNDSLCSSIDDNDDDFQSAFSPPPIAMHDCNQNSVSTETKDELSLLLPGNDISNQRRHARVQDEGDTNTTPNTKKQEAPSIPPPPPLKAASFSLETNKGSQETCFDENCTCLNEVKEIGKGHSIDSSAEIAKAQKKGEEQSNALQNCQETETNSGLETTGPAEEDNTMEATWRAITEAGAEAKKKLTKSETWAQPARAVAVAQENREETDSEGLLPKSTLALKELRKSMTFNETVSIRFRGGLMRGPSISLEDLNNRFEAFIKNFNKEIRLQRQESEQRYQEMISRSF